MKRSRVFAARFPKTQPQHPQIDLTGVLVHALAVGFLVWQVVQWIAGRIN